MRTTQDIELEAYLADDRDNGNQPAVVVRVSDVEAEKVRWLWPGRLPFGKVALLDGDPALGKSTFTLDLTARLTTASPLADGHKPDECRSVVILSAEDGIGDTIRPRLEAAGADLKRVVVLEAVRRDDSILTRPPSLPSDVALLEDVVRGEGAGLVVVDVLNAFLASSVDSHRDQDVRGALLPLARMAERTGACVIALRHLNKAGGGNPLYRGGGSIGIVGAARAALLVAPDPQDPQRRILAVSKNNLAPLAPALAYRLVTDELYDTARIQWEGPCAHTAADLLAVPNEDERTARDEAVEFLADVLSEGPVPAKEVKRAARDAGIAERTLERAKKRADVTTYREGFGGDGKWFWKIKDRPESSMAAIDAQPPEFGELASFGALWPEVAPNGDGQESPDGPEEDF